LQISVIFDTLNKIIFQICINQIFRCFSKIVLSMYEQNYGQCVHKPMRRLSISTGSGKR